MTRRGDDRRVLLFDKSSLEGLRTVVHDQIGQSFNVVVAPILIHETQGAFVEGREADFLPMTPGERTQSIARKIRPAGERVLRHWQGMCIASLLGNEPSKNLEDQLQRGVEAIDGDGKRIVLTAHQSDGATVTPQHYWLKSAAEGRWTSTYPRDGRTYESRFDELAGSILRNQHFRAAKPTTPGEVSGLTRLVLDDASSTLHLLDWLGDMVAGRRISTAQLRTEVRRRWRAQEKPHLKDFAPFAHHCALVKLLYLAGTEIWPGRRENNDFGDLEYLAYLPLTDVFVSDDKFVRAMAGQLMRADQDLTCSCQLRSHYTGATQDSDKCMRAHGQPTAGFLLRA